jgi:hypothetical protein
MRKLARAFWVLIALVFLLETWLWDRLKPIVAWSVDHVLWRKMKGAAALRIAELSPSAALIVFVIPVAILVPIKIAALWLMAHGAWWGALGVLLLGKLVGLGVTAFLFDLIREKLLQMATFRALYERVMAWRAWAHAEVRPLRHRLSAILFLIRPRRTQRLIRRLARLRAASQMQSPPFEAPAFRPDAPRAAQTAQSP